MRQGLISFLVSSRQSAIGSQIWTARPSDSQTLRPSDPQIETQRVETPYTKCRGFQTLRLSDLPSEGRNS